LLLLVEQVQKVAEEDAFVMIILTIAIVAMVVYLRRELEEHKNKNAK
jgi:hypothetical protein|tara:strand:+ start:1602 stop:1742 length:141 start_codon:yes stop_codon:yes gene_type:complete